MSEQLTYQEQPTDIVEWFVPGFVTNGRAPEQIKKQWQGVPIPIRRAYSTPQRGDSTPDKFVYIMALDGIKALELTGHPVAATWWTQFLKIDKVLATLPESENLEAVGRGQPADTFDTGWRPGLLARLNILNTRLLFLKDQGKVYSPGDILELYPDATRFDELSIDSA